jgi:hypothetical protein
MFYLYNNEFIEKYTEFKEHVRNNKYLSAAKKFRDKIDDFFSQTHPKKMILIFKE